MIFFKHKIRHATSLHEEEYSKTYLLTALVTGFLLTSLQLAINFPLSFLIKCQYIRFPSSQNYFKKSKLCNNQHSPYHWYRPKCCSLHTSLYTCDVIKSIPFILKENAFGRFLKKIYKPDSEFAVVSKAIFATDYFFFSGVYYTRYKAPSVFFPPKNVSQRPVCRVIHFAIKITRR